MRSSTTARRAHRVTAALAAAGLGLASGLAACGGTVPEADTSTLTEVEQQGLEVAQRSGCASCHGGDFGGGVGPTFQGLAGSTVTLTDGSTVTADAAYLTESIMDPSAKLVDGYDIAMPTNFLPAEDVAKIVAYIQALD